MNGSLCAVLVWRVSARLGDVRGLESNPECTKIAHHRSLAIFTADSGIAGNSAMGICFAPFNRRENRRSLAIFDREEIVHLGALKLVRICRGAVKFTATAAENRAARFWCTHE